VHGQDADASAVAAARRAADGRGLLNRRVSFDLSGLERLLPVGRSCDLVVLSDLKAQELTSELAAEIGRVLHPWYGVAVLGDASGTLDRAALTENSNSEETKLTAFHRTDGTELWEVELPAGPVHDGLAVAADGRVIVALRDGTVLCIGE